MKAHAIDLIGIRVGRLVVISYEGRNKQSKQLFRCKCDCGNEVVTTKSSLTRKDEVKRTKSCGCARRESMLRVHTKHGMATRKGTVPEFGVWKDMIKRCTNEKRDDFKYYGGRGISVCERWLDFGNFYADMGERPDGMTIDRINTRGNYEPGNCRWITIQEQQNNRRSCVYVEHEGRTQNMKQWARELGISYEKVRAGIKSGKSMSEILTGSVHC